MGHLSQLTLLLLLLLLGSCFNSLPVVPQTNAVFNVNGLFKKQTSKGIDAPRNVIQRKAPHLSTTDQAYNEVVVFTTAFITNCKASRLKSLVTSANRDVWFLHDHDRLARSHRVTRITEHSIKLTESIDGLYSVQQHSGAYPHMIDIVDCHNGPCSKNAFLHFTVHAQDYKTLSGPFGFDNKKRKNLSELQDMVKKYEYFWLIEDDSFYTGSWSTFFHNVNYEDYKYRVNNVDPNIIKNKSEIKLS